jgi:hypothetical protein
MSRVLDQLREQLPVDDVVLPMEHEKAEHSQVRPLGLMLASVPDAAATVDVGMLRWDEAQQVMTLAGGGEFAPAFKHTSDKTSTSTASQDRTGPDSDTDAGGR